MNDDSTKKLPDSRSFEERVFARFDAMDARFDAMDARFDAMDARFDAMDARFDAMDARLDAMETRFESRFDNVEMRLENLESRALDTKPIWERALAAIMDLGLEMSEVKTRVGVIEQQIVQLRAGYAGLHHELVETQRDFKKKLDRRIELVLTTLLDTRDGIRDADERLTQLETKLA